MTLTDQQVLDIVNALLDREGIHPVNRAGRLHTGHGGAASLTALRPLVDRYLAITGSPDRHLTNMGPPRTCQVEHDHWEGRMICGNPMPCPRHGGG